ncbi:MAG: chromate transporter [Tepidanaerobacteraceae bacterium]|nr:chromate transporter [Tepidanaerobacteraceae bacterium]
MNHKLSLKEMLIMFWAFFKIGTFTLGGGFAMIPLMKVEMVDKQKWIKEEEFLDIIAVTQSAPGAVAINSSIYIGYRLAGFLGSVIATLGTVLPSFLIILCVVSFYADMKANPYVKKAFCGIYPAIVVLILAAAINLWKAAFRDKAGIVIALLSLAALVVFDVHPILVIVVSGLVGIFLKKTAKQGGDRK